MGMHDSGVQEKDECYHEAHVMVKLDSDYVIKYYDAWVEAVRAGGPAGRAHQLHSGPLYCGAHSRQRAAAAAFDCYTCACRAESISLWSMLAVATCVGTSKASAARGWQRRWCGGWPYR